MSILSKINDLMKEIYKETGENTEIDITLPYKARLSLTLDHIKNQDRGLFDSNSYDPNCNIVFNTVAGIVNIKPISEETRLRNEIKSRKEHLEQLESRLQELL